MSPFAHKTERVLNLRRELQPAKVNEVIDFAEHLKINMGAVDQNAFERSSLYGERLDTLLA